MRDAATDDSKQGLTNEQPPTGDIVLWLDLSEDNQQSEASVRANVPAGAEILPLTALGVTRCPRGRPARWRPVLDGIDRLVHQARERERRSPGCRYWVTGRAALPAFFFLGQRLGKMAAITFVHQPHNGGATAILPLPQAGPTPPGDHAAAVYFARSPWPLSRSEAVAPVAFAVSSRQVIDDLDIQRPLARPGDGAPLIVHAHADAWLDANTVAVATREIDELIRAIRAARPARKTLAVFLACPTSLAFLLGNAINPQVCRDIQVFDYDGGRYTLAYELPFPPIPERNNVLWLGSSPVGSKPLALEEEIRLIEGARNAGANERLRLVAIPAARPKDLLRQLQDKKPGVIHFSGHGAGDGPVFEDDDGQMRPLSVADLADVFRLAGDPVHLIVIAACFSDSYADALLAHVSCVIVMRGKIFDSDASKFASELYLRLAEGDSVREAFELALTAMRLERPALPDAPLVAAGEAPKLRERDPGCASNLYLVRKP
jgi:hypothetical protein